MHDLIRSVTMAIVRFLLIFLLTIGCWYLPERQVPALWFVQLSKVEAAIQIETTPQLPQVILRENLIQQATNCIAQEWRQREAISVIPWRQYGRQQACGYPGGILPIAAACPMVFANPF